MAWGSRSGSQQEVDQEAQHREEEGGRQEFRGPKDAKLRGDGLDHRQARACAGKLQSERRDSESSSAPALASRGAMPQGTKRANPMQA